MQNRLRAFKGVRHGLIVAFNSTLWGRLNIVDFRQRGFRSGPWLKQFGAKSHGNIILGAINAPK
jgi:hypothetical protein